MQATDREPGASRPGLVESAKRLAATLVSIVHTRLELVATELQEEIARLASVVIWSVAALLLAVVGLAFLAVAIVLAAAPAWRAVVAGAIAAALIAAAVLAWLVARRVQRAKPRAFDASLAELERDDERLRGES
jgi:uncharacterized membrane protein YqjE